jgi:hypothetical protein
MRATIAVFAAIALVGTTGMSASADEVPPSDSLRLQIMVDGQLTDLPDYNLDMVDPATLPVDEVSPQLIDFNQWVRCFTQNQADDVFAEYAHWWDGRGQDVRLKCGDSGYGYKHIRERHENDWQNVLNRAVAAGYEPSDQGIDSWDDLMAASAGEAITWPEYRWENATNQTTCVVAEIYLVNVDTGQILYSFQSRAAFSNTNDRLITAFPQSQRDCN